MKSRAFSSYFENSSRLGKVLDITFTFQYFFIFLEDMRGEARELETVSLTSISATNYEMFVTIWKVLLTSRRDGCEKNHVTPI